LVALTSAAEATETLRVGSLVFDNDYRHPVVLAKQMATLDLASDGRLEVGLGAGWLTSDYVESGIPHDSAGVRVSRMEEAIHILKALWRDGTCSFEGEHYTLNSAQGHPRPVTQPHPTLLIGGGGKRMLSIAAREADIVGVNPNLKAGYVGPEVAAEARPEKWDERIAWVKEAAGDRFDDIELQCLTFMVQFTDDRDAAYENLAPLFGMTPAEAAEVPIALAGTVEQMAESLQQRREEYGFSYVVVHEPEMEQFGEVVAKLAGT
jgi:probable F420-dependent oxidoreductase